MIDKSILAQLPGTPGVYKFLDDTGEILYIGKAHNLRARVSSYFSSDHSDRPRIIGMIPLIASIVTTQTDNDIEALVLESALIREFLPKYNSALKDDKSYAWLYVTTKDKYPTVKIVRTEDKNEFNRGQLFGPYPSGKAIKRVFNYLRKLYPFCTAKDPTKECFYSRIGLCPGPNASIEEYRSNINNIIKFLKGKNKNHIKMLERQMAEYSANQEYEKAGELRDKIYDLKYLGAEIKFTYFNSEQEYLVKRDERIFQSLEKLSKEIGVSLLERIECYDISNIQGKFAVGSMTVALNGKSENRMYRTFKIKGEEKPDDPRMIKEVITRRLAHIDKDTDISLNAKPNLIMIDGAITQLNEIKDIIPSDILLMGISKGRYMKRQGKQKKDEFWINRSGFWEKIDIKNREILVNLRDEAHRFAITYHRKLRGQLQTHSILDDISGLGPKRKSALMKAFGTVNNMRSADVEAIQKVIRSKELSQKIFDTLTK